MPNDRPGAGEGVASLLEVSKRLKRRRDRLAAGLVAISRRIEESAARAGSRPRSGMPKPVSARPKPSK